VRKDAITAAVVAAARAGGLGVLGWTVNDPRDYDRLDAAGVDGVFTDFPERFLQPPGHE